MSLSGPELLPESLKDKLKDAYSFKEKLCIPFLLTPMWFSNNPYRYREVTSERLCCAERQLVTSSGCKESTGKFEILVVGKTYGILIFGKWLTLSHY